ncbi:hypothetical protein [Staphylococcus shinii]
MAYVEALGLLKLKTAVNKSIGIDLITAKVNVLIMDGKSPC